MYIDTHCHLNLEQFADDYKEVIRCANLVDVKAIINVGSNLANSKRAVEIAREFETGIYATVGMHPTDANLESFNEKKITDLLYSKRVVAIGEIGLDYLGEKVDKQAQLELLKQQINLALKVKKPIVVHCREAYDDLITILKSMPAIPRGVIHCYTGDLAHAKIFLDLGFYLSFTGIITFAKSAELEQVVEKTSLSKMMIETDAPWLAPEPHRGHRNEPSYVIDVARKIAEIKKLQISEVETQTTKNAVDLFKLELK